MKYNQEVIRETLVTSKSEKAEARPRQTDHTPREAG